MFFTSFDNLSLRVKLLLNQEVASGTLLLAIVFWLLSLPALIDEAHDIAGSDLPSIQAAGMISQNRSRYRVRRLEFMPPNAPEEQATIEESLAGLEDDVEKSIHAYEPLVFTTKEKTMVAELFVAAHAHRRCDLATHRGRRSARRNRW